MTFRQTCLGWHALNHTYTAVLCSFHFLSVLLHCLHFRESPHPSQSDAQRVQVLIRLYDAFAAWGRSKYWIAQIWNLAYLNAPAHGESECCTKKCKRNAPIIRNDYVHTWLRFSQHLVLTERNRLFCRCVIRYTYVPRDGRICLPYFHLSVVVSSGMEVSPWIELVSLRVEIKRVITKGGNLDLFNKHYRRLRRDRVLPK